MGLTSAFDVWGYDVSPVCFRAEVNNGKDAGVEDAFKDPDFPHDESSLKNSRFPELLALSSQQQNPSATL